MRVHNKTINNLFRFPALTLVTSIMIVWPSFIRATAIHQQDIVVNDYSCTNKSVSSALRSLSIKSGIVINCIIDQIEEPLVTMSCHNVTIGEILDRIMIGMTNYEVMVGKESLLVCPKGILRDNSFILNHSIPECVVSNYWLPDDNCMIFEIDPKPFIPLNIALMGPLYVLTKSNTTSSSSRIFTNHTLLSVLTSLSEEGHTSFFLSRVRPTHIQKYNADERKDGLNQSWWPNRNAPGYCLSWRTGAFHGEYAFIRETTTKDGQSRLEPITWNQAESEESSQKVSENDARSRELDILIAQAIESGSEKTTKLEISLASETSNQTITAILNMVLTNISEKKIIVPNPLNDDLQQAFWNIQLLDERAGKKGVYRVVIRDDSHNSKATPITLNPHKSVSLMLNIQSAKLVRNDSNSARGFSGAKNEIFGKDKAYSIVADFCHRDESGVWHISASNLIDVRQED